MAADQPLTGIDLIDCAKANATQSLAKATQLCGYGSDTSRFQLALKQAGKEMGVELDSLDDLITDQFRVKQTQGLEIAPDSTEDL
ncbi:MAG: hypothetical protein HLUCCA11_17525 [Phormidesmis priestleyi Ana]|uniref:Uncharacterized protein n=1 Tax=Phormidesmis priestleyi Ana TaxID=1666911 RepID=A0A0N8KMG5_9CYAN|nr:MAG: hypothetical protein HLUCCA11_17525 [Phormidesmis priestleyi Ana]